MGIAVGAQASGEGASAGHVPDGPPGSRMSPGASRTVGRRCAVALVDLSWASPDGYGNDATHGRDSPTCRSRPDRAPPDASPSSRAGSDRWRASRRPTLALGSQAIPFYGLAPLISLSWIRVLGQPRAADGHTLTTMGLLAGRRERWSAVTSPIAHPRAMAVASLPAAPLTLGLVRLPAATTLVALIGLAPFIPTSALVVLGQGTCPVTSAPPPK